MLIIGSSAETSDVSSYVMAVPIIEDERAIQTLQLVIMIIP
jgi:hypothetical protein